MARDSRLARRGRVVFLRMDRFLRRGIWESDYRRHRGPSWFLVRQLQVILLAVKGMKEDEVRLRSASLSLITLLSVVPFLAVIFWVFQALGGVEDLRSRVEPFIYENLAVGAQEEAIAWLNQFIAQIHTGAVGGIGTGILLISAIGLLASMEESFNRVWAVPRGRPLLGRFVIYWCLLTVGPLVLAASLGGTAALQGWLPLGERFAAPALALLPTTITIGAFTLLYMVIPHTQVRLRHALVGGITAGLLFEIAKLAYAWIAGHLFQHHAIYGSLGAVPVFIIWVNITWLIVLFGCELTFANQNVGTLRHEERARAANQQVRELVACRLVLEIAIDFYRGVFPPSASVLSARLDAPVRLVRGVLESLRAGGLVLEASGSRADAGFVPARELARITVGDVIWAMRMRQTGPFDLPADERQTFLRGLLGRADEAAGGVYGESDYLELSRRFVEEAPDGAAASPVRDAL
jgi:membrane protein